METVKIEIKGGLVQRVEASKDVNIIIVDYDNPSVENYSPDEIKDKETIHLETDQESYRMELNN